VNGFQNTGLLFNPVLIRTFPYSTFGAGFVVLNKDQEWVFTGAVYDTNDTPTVSGFKSSLTTGWTCSPPPTCRRKFIGQPDTKLSSQPTAPERTSISSRLRSSTRRGACSPESHQERVVSLAYAFDQAVYVSPDDPSGRGGCSGTWDWRTAIQTHSTGAPTSDWAAPAHLRGVSKTLLESAISMSAVSDSLKQLAPQLLPIRDEQGVELFYNVAATLGAHHAGPASGEPRP